MVNGVEVGIGDTHRAICDRQEAGGWSSTRSPVLIAVEATYPRRSSWGCKG